VHISEPLVEHLTQLLHKFDCYIPEDPRPGNLWILNTFVANSAAEEVALSGELKAKLIELSKGSSLKQKKILQGMPFIVRACHQKNSIAFYHHLPV